MSIFDVKNWFLAHRLKINLEASAYQKTKILVKIRWSLNKKWLVEHHTCMLDRVIRGQGAASFPRPRNWQIYWKFSKNQFLTTILKYKFKSKKIVCTSKRALSDGKVCFSRLFVYDGKKHTPKSKIWGLFLMLEIDFWRIGPRSI